MSEGRERRERVPFAIFTLAAAAAVSAAGLASRAEARLPAGKPAPPELPAAGGSG